MSLQIKLQCYNSKINFKIYAVAKVPANNTAPNSQYTCKLYYKSMHYLHDLFQSNMVLY